MIFHLLAMWSAIAQGTRKDVVASLRHPSRKLEIIFLWFCQGANLPKNLQPG